MSYIRARVDQQMELDADTDGVEHGFRVRPVDFDAGSDIDRRLDGEELVFALDLIAKVNELREGEVLVVWKEIF